MQYSKDTLRLWVLAGLFLVGLPLAILFGAPQDPTAKRLTREYRFAYVSWVTNALFEKGSSAISGDHRKLNTADASQYVRDYFALVSQAQHLEREIEVIYTDPDQATDDADLLVEELTNLRADMETRRNTVEAILQAQVTNVLLSEGFGVAGQIVPPVAMSITALPERMIVSRRDKIEQIEFADLAPNTALADIETLENTVDTELDVASLVVPLGGLSLYPAMVYETTSLSFTINTTAHEWAHHYLMARPLGTHYFENPETQVINETTANIVGKEISAKVVALHYPELIPPPPTEPSPEQDTPTAPPAPVFDFREQMRITRIRVDELLEAGEIEQAEAYMNERQEEFFEQGYLIRKINQAYFAFYGSYADQAGARGEDPIGPAVTALREQSNTLIDFVNTISWMTSLEEVVTATGN